LSPQFLARPDLIREISNEEQGPLSGYAVGNPYRSGNPWQRKANP
jgi:hypothetical protein